MTTSFKKYPFFAVIALCVSTMSACAIVDIREDVSYNYQGGQIAQPLLGQVIPGVTTRQWLIDNLGDPANENIDNNESQVIYQFNEHINTRTRILFLFYYRSSKVVPRQLTIELRDGVVTRVGPSYFDKLED